MVTTTFCVSLQAPIQSKETLSTEYLKIWASVFFRHFIHSVSPIIRFFQGSSIFSYQKSNNALPLVNTWSNENLPKSCLSYSHPSNIYYLVCQPCQNKQKTFNILRILTYWPFTQKGTQRWLLHKNNPNVKAIIIL